MEGITIWREPEPQVYFLQNKPMADEVIERIPFYDRTGNSGPRTVNRKAVTRRRKANKAARRARRA